METIQVERTKDAAILQNELDKMLSAKEDRNKEMINGIEKSGNMINDFVAPVGDVSKVGFDANGKVEVLINMNGEVQRFGIHRHAVGQAGERLGIPTKYIKDLSSSEQEWERKLSAEILNDHIYHSDRAKVLLRTVGGELRGFLSDKYRRLNTAEIYGSFLSAIRETGAVVHRAHYDDTKSWIDTIVPQVIAVPTEKNGIVHMVFGCRISNSDFGDGALDLRAYGIQVVCFNGMTRENLMRQVHLGKRLSENLELSERTYMLDTKTQASAVRDLVRLSMGKEAIEQQAFGIQKASEMSINMETEVKKLPKSGMLKGEVEDVEKALMNNRKEDGVQGEPTLWKLSQAVTAVSRTAEERRKRELEEIGGKLLERVKI